MTPREAYEAAFVRETELRRQLASVAPEDRAELERRIRAAAAETREALLAIRPAAPEGRGLQTLRRAS